MGPYHFHLVAAGAQEQLSPLDTAWVPHFPQFPPLPIVPVCFCFFTLPARLLQAFEFAFPAKLCASQGNKLVGTLPYYGCGKKTATEEGGCRRKNMLGVRPRWGGN